MLLTDFSSWLATLLETAKYKDYCVNGLCVEASSTVSNVVTGVSFRESLIDEAIECDADCIIVHHPHGFWSGDDKMPVGALGRKIQKLMKNNISLFGFHLPLDGHVQIGNNAIIASRLGLKRVGGFIEAGERDVGIIGAFDLPITRKAFVHRVQELFPLGIQSELFFGPEHIHKVGICSGGGSSYMNEAFALGVDLYLTGEIKEETPIFVEEERHNLIACGHHRTEIFGVEALAEKIKADLKMPASFVNIDNAI